MNTRGLNLSWQSPHATFGEVVTYAERCHNGEFVKTANLCGCSPGIIADGVLRLGATRTLGILLALINLQWSDGGNKTTDLQE